VILSIITPNKDFCNSLPSLNAETIVVKNNLNNALLDTRGKYVCFLGRNEIEWKPDKVEKQINILETQNLSFIGTSVEIYYDERPVRVVNYPENHEDCYREFYRYKNNFVFDDSVIFRRYDAIQVGGFSLFIKDSEKESVNTFCLALWCRLLLSGKKCGNI